MDAVIVITVVNVLVLLGSLKLYTERRKERVKDGKRPGGA